MNPFPLSLASNSASELCAALDSWLIDFKEAAC